MTLLSHFREHRKPREIRRSRHSCNDDFHPFLFRKGVCPHIYVMGNEPGTARAGDPKCCKPAFHRRSMVAILVGSRRSTTFQCVVPAIRPTSRLALWLSGTTTKLRREEALVFTATPTWRSSPTFAMVSS